MSDGTRKTSSLDQASPLDPTASSAPQSSLNTGASRITAPSVGRATSLDHLLADLSEPQREAVTHTDGPLLILAGPGSGKTRVVTRRAAYLASTVARPYEILAITFTNKAAGEMRERIGSLGLAEGMTVCTFHAFCAKLLRVYHERFDISRNFTIYDTDDRRKVIKDAIERCHLSSENWTPATVERHISLAKNELLDAAGFEGSVSDWRLREVARIYQEYERQMTEMAALDFDDLLMLVAKLLDRDAELCDELECRYRYVLIDEYQDTNLAQYRIARLISQRRKNLCATGDPDQSIYGWRGANIENILNFERDYPKARVVRLEQNYRSTKRILAVADNLIVGNQRRKEKALWTANEEGVPVHVAEFDQADDEAETIARSIVQHVENGDRYSEVAIFYRVNSLSRVLEETLFKAGIPYQVARGVEFYNRKEIKDVLAYLRVLVNPADEVALRRMINTPPRGIGATSIERLEELCRASGRRVFDALTNGSDLSSLGRSAGKVSEFAALLRQLGEAVKMPAPDALRFVLSHSGLRAMYAREGDDEDAPIHNLDELVNAATEFQNEFPDSTIVDWLEFTALVSDVDSVDKETDRVTLMTLHAAKGLEFPVVFIIGVEDGLIPFRREEHVSDMEEERRLLFVGMTRAKRELTLSLAHWRMRQGATMRTLRSPFLDEIPQDGVEWAEVEDEAPVSSRPARSGGGRLPPDIDQWSSGTLVRHPVYGIGQILTLFRGARRTHVDVQFQRGQRMQWVLEFAELERVDYDEVGDTG